MKRRGMTLGEVLMGLALLAMILVMAALVLQWALHGSQTQQNKTIAAFLAQQQMEELMDAPEPASSQGHFSSPHDSFSWTSRVEAIAKEPFLEITVAVEGPRGARFRLKAQRRKTLRSFVYRCQEQLLRSSEDLTEAEPVADGVGKWGYSLAPNGSTLAFVAWKEGSPQILSRELGQEAAPTLLADGGQEPCYSPDGKKLAFTARDQVFVRDLARRIQSPMGRGGSPCWTADSRGLIVCRDSSSLVLLQDGSETVLVESDSGWNAAPALSPDGRQLAFMSNRDGNPEIYILDLRTKHLKRLTDDPGYDSQPQFSPDGKRLIYSSRGVDGEVRLFSMNVDGTRACPLTPEATGEEPQWLR